MAHHGREIGEQGVVELDRVATEVGDRVVPGARAEDEGVVAVAAGQQVVAGAAGQGVVAVVAGQAVVAVTGGQDVVAANDSAAVAPPPFEVMAGATLSGVPMKP